MHVAVCIVGFRNPEDIQACLAALARSTYIDFQVVICENGGAQAFAALAPVVPAVLAGGQAVEALLAPGNLGYAGGVNLCIRHAPDADAWWVLNPDAEAHPGALAALVAKLADGSCEAVGCTVELPGGIVQSYGGLWQGWLGRAVSLGNGTRRGTPPDAAVIEGQQNFLNGACMLVGRPFIETVGLMREDYFLYCEEVEWSLRALKRDMRLGFTPHAVVLHRQGSTTGHSTSVRTRPRSPVYLNERNKLLLTQDWMPSRFPVVIVAAFLLLFLKYLRRGAWRQFGYALSGWWAGLMNERGPPRWLGA